MFVSLSVKFAQLGHSTVPVNQVCQASWISIKNILDLGHSVFLFYTYYLDVSQRKIMDCCFALTIPDICHFFTRKNFLKIEITPKNANFLR